MTVIRYDHAWGERSVNVAVLAENKGKHKDNCLCFQGCRFFKPGEADNCGLAEANYEFCVRNDMVCPVWECPMYQPVVESPLATSPVA